MDRKDTNPSANVPSQSNKEPLGDRGQGDKTWSPQEGEQGISNRPDDLAEASQPVVSPAETMTQLSRTARTKKSWKRPKKASVSQTWRGGTNEGSND